jgi:hypothetical protein
MERANVTTSRLVNVGLVSGLEYANLDFVRRFVRSIDQSRFSLVLTADVVACKVAEREALGRNVTTRWVKWRCRPWKLVPFCAHLVMLYDGGNLDPLSDLATFAAKNAPNTGVSLFGPEGPIQNGIDFLDRARVTVSLPRREGWGARY